MNISDLVRQYLINTEEYDKTVCSGEKDGIAIPMTSHERALICKYALRWRECILRLGYSDEELQRELWSTSYAILLNNSRVISPDHSRAVWVET
jgi:hypothetical protein